ncbi:transglycosylase domain-containing protein [Reichenbachiella versicolor]|uniref:transglycosylase domain-containing protein n=1 Tax=Reichenbachiella versicolor TaxID=1821036 RepID=UPI000D6DDC42|nr:transglycosylase domain-containing protein [Reichenbachiella versicolor]
MYKKLILAIWAVVLIIFLGIGGTFLMIKIDAFGLFGGLPSLRSLERPDPDLSSILYSSDGEELGKYYRHNRTQASYNDLSQELITTLLVTEDIRFTKHSGIDLRSFMRAFVGYITLRSKAGGSTITMQLAENLYQTNDENTGSLYRFSSVGKIITKLKEFIISIQLESSYTKEEILAMYLNTIEYGSNSYGINTAAKTYFNKKPKDLNYKEAAVLVGLINKPTKYNPILNPDHAMNKRTEVLYNLFRFGKINREVYDSLKTSDFGLNYKIDNHNTGPATYFKNVIGNYLRWWAKENGHDLYADGLRIYTTIDSKLQQYAEDAVAEEMSKLQQIFIDHLGGDAPWIDRDGHEILDFVDNAIKRTENYKYLAKKYGEESDSLNYYLNLPKDMKVFSYKGEIDTTMSLVDSLKYYKHFLQTGFMAMDPYTGHIKAWVGGVNHKYFKFDHVKQSKRQPGSTFKPFIYATAIDQGYSPCYPVVDAPVTWTLDDPENPTWTPENAGGKFTGQTMTIRKAMANSVNSITANMMQKVGPQAAVDMAHACGIESDLAAVPALCLGISEVSLFELVGAYSTFVNSGTWTKPFYVTRIEDKNGVVLEDFIPKRREAISEKTAYLMIHMLKGATEEVGGSANSVDYRLKENNELGGKTGTTQSASDGWFMGVTHDLVAGAWVGGDDRSIHFKNWYMGQGARTARPIWQNFMLKVYNDPRTGITKGEFKKPSVALDVELDCNLYIGGSTEADSVNADVDQMLDDLENIQF